MKRLILLAVLTAGCATQTTIPTTVPDVTTTEPVTTTTPTTTTTEATTTTEPVSEKEIAESVYLYTTNTGLERVYDDETLLELGYDACEMMREAQADGYTSLDYVQQLLDVWIENPDLDETTLTDYVKLSGAATGSLCIDMYDWGQQ